MPRSTSGRWSHASPIWSTSLASLRQYPSSPGIIPHLQTGSRARMAVTTACQSGGSGTVLRDPFIGARYPVWNLNRPVYRPFASVARLVIAQYHEVTSRINNRDQLPARERAPELAGMV